MTSRASDSESWKKMVLRSMKPPAWLNPDAPHGEIVLSTRIRYARNLTGFAYPHHASSADLRQVQQSIEKQANLSPIKFEAFRSLSEAEKDFLVGTRLISPDFAHREHGRVVLIDRDRRISLMINEEDHIRLQALTAGWSLGTASRSAESVLNSLRSGLQFQYFEPWGYLTASPYNAGAAKRMSAMFHLIGMAHTKRLNAVIKALSSQSLSARGLFGESSRAVGAFFQVSSTRDDESQFIGACEYLIKEEREARSQLSGKDLEDKVKSVVDFATRSPDISLADALRVLAWVRWGASFGIDRCPKSYREVDSWMSIIEVRGTTDETAANRQRAVFLRARLGT